MKWSELTATPDSDAMTTLRSKWHWLLGAEWTPLLFSAFGDAFIEKDGQVQWLNTGTGAIIPIAKDRGEFHDKLGSDYANDWFMPGLVAALHDAGKYPTEGQCFTYAIYPVFAEGKYEVGNFAVVPIKEHFGLSGDLHRQIASLPEGATVRLQMEP